MPSRRSVAVALGLGLVASTLALTSTSPAHAADPVEIQIVGTNDFHGRLLPDRDIPGAAKYAGAVDALRAQNPNTIFAAAGDLIGATTFESFINEDKPTIDVLNAMGLDVSAVGNHELDQGYDDLVDRVMAPESEANPTAVQRGSTSQRTSRSRAAPTTSPSPGPPRSTGSPSASSAP